MIPRKIIVNLCVFAILVIGAQLVSASNQVVKYEEPFPPRFPLQTLSKVAFTQYLDVPMLSLMEIKKGFPWLKISDESNSERELRRSEKSGQRYVFHYVPSETTDSFHEAENIGLKFHPRDEEFAKFDSGDEKRREKKQGSNLRLEKLIKQPSQSVVEEHISRGSRNKEREGEVEGRRYERYRKPDREIDSGPKTSFRGDESKSKARDELRNRLIQYSETRQIPSYLYSRIPSRFMRPPRVEYEDKDFWLKRKRNSKLPTTKDSRAEDEERLKNHKIVKKKKVKNVNQENNENLKNHKPVYDREHDPEEQVEETKSSIRDAKKPRSKRPKEKPKNHSLLSQDGERVQFQIHGHEGPQSYIFGYDTGDGENRHFRIEERLQDGSVKGHYGYYDSDGKLKMVEYKASPMAGFKEEHHQSEGKSDEQQRERRR